MPNADALLAAWETTARRYADAVAVRDASSGTAVTFAELARRGRAWSACHGAAALSGRAVVFAVPNGAPWFEVFLGLQQTRAVAVPLDPGEPADTVGAIAQALRAAAWWDGTQLCPLARSARLDRGVAPVLAKLTSGSTGAPRPLSFTARQMLADGRQVMRGMGLRPSDTNYALIPFGHSYGLGNLVMPLLSAGLPLLTGMAPLPHAIAADFARWRPTVFPGVPALWRALAESDVRLPGLRLAISAGAPLAPETAQAFFRRHGVRLHNFYGSSETGGVSYDPSGESTLLGGVGKPLPGVRVRALRGRRLRVSGGAVFTIGNRRRVGTAGAWVMPDLVELTAQNEMRVVGRTADFAKIGGRRVSLGEVTTQLRALPGVSEAWVATGGDSDAVLGAALISRQSPAALRAAALARMPAWKIPKVLVCLESLPLTARGKPDRAALRRTIFGPRE